MIELFVNMKTDCYARSETTLSSTAFKRSIATSERKDFQIVLLY